MLDAHGIAITEQFVMLKVLIISVLMVRHVEDIRLAG